MTETECREPEPNALLERLLRRYTEPFGVIDVRHVQAHYERIAGWMEARFPLLVALAARHDLGADAEIGTGAFVYAGRTALRPSDQAVHVPDTPAVPAPALPRGGSMSEKSRLAPVLQGREGGDSEKGAMGTLRAAASSAPPEVEPATTVGRVRRAAPRSVEERAGSEELPRGDGKTPTNLDPLAISGSIAARRSVDPHTSNVVQNHLHKSGSSFSLGEKARMRGIKSNSFVDDFDPLTPTLSRREREKKTVPVSEEKTTGYAQDRPPSAADPVTLAGIYPVPQEVTPARTVWHVRRAAPGMMAVPSPESTPSPDQTSDPPHTPAVGAPPRGRPPRSPDHTSEPLPQAALVRSKGALDGLHRGAPSSAPLALGAPMDPRGLPLARVRTPAANVDRAMDIDDPRLHAGAFVHAPSLDRPSVGLRSRVTEHPAVTQADVPIPERHRLRLGKREWAQLIERLSRLIWHRLAVDLDRRGIRSWRE
jgi:hypothetical protein